MGNVQPENRYTRRAALTLAAAAPAWSQTQRGQKPSGCPVIHFEIGCRDRAKAGKFFEGLFGWKIDSSPAGTIDTASQKGVGGHITSLGHEPEHYTTFYVEVEDVKAALDRAVALGGKVVVPPVKFPGGTFAWFSDLDGNTIGLLKPA